jgi:hypothetical protein
MANKVDDNICPLCGQPNRCEVQLQQGCWCMNTDVPSVLLAQVPIHLQGASCICNRCIAKYHQQHAQDST